MLNNATCRCKHRQLPDDFLVGSVIEECSARGHIRKVEKSSKVTGLMSQKIHIQHFNKQHPTKDYKLKLPHFPKSSNC